MGRSPCSSEERLNRGLWTAQEDMALCEYIRIHGHGRWRNVAQKAGLKRSGKSCRLRWLNYLRPDIKRGGISVDEEELIIRLHRLLGNRYVLYDCIDPPYGVYRNFGIIGNGPYSCRWSLIAGRLPGRTDNEIKNHWNTALHKKVAMYECQVRRSPESPSPTQIQKQHVLKPIPLKITTAVTPSRCNGDGTNEGFNWSNVKETMRTSKLCTDFLLNGSVAYEESDRIASASETLEHCRNPTCSMSLLVDHFGGEAVTLDEILMGFNELSSRDWILLSSDPSPSSEDLRFVESYTGPWIHELIDDNMKQIIEGVTLDFP